MYDHSRFAPFYSIQLKCDTQGYAFTLVHSVAGLEFFPQYILHDVGSRVSSRPNMRINKITWTPVEKFIRKKEAFLAITAFDRQKSSDSTYVQHYLTRVK